MNSLLQHKECVCEWPAAKPRLRAAHVAKHRRWVKDVCAFSTQHKETHPFGRGRGPEQIESGESDELTLGQRIIRNQVITRTAPVAGRSIVAAGTLLVASGARSYRATKPNFVTITKRAAIRRAKLDAAGRNVSWRTLYRQRYPVGTVHYRSGYTTRGVTEQRRAALRRHSRGAVTRTAVGGTAIVVGRAVPVLAYGYLGYDLVKRTRAEGDTKSNQEQAQRDLTGGMTFSETKALAGQAYAAAKIGQLVLKELVT
jgi:hypothetical protein